MPYPILFYAMILIPSSYVNVKNIYPSDAFPPFKSRDSHRTLAQIFRYCRLNLFFPLATMGFLRFHTRTVKINFSRFKFPNSQSQSLPITRLKVTAKFKSHETG